MACSGAVGLCATSAAGEANHPGTTLQRVGCCVPGTPAWRFVDGESSIARIVAIVDDNRYDELMQVKAECELTKFGDIAGAKNPHLHEVGRT